MVGVNVARGAVLLSEVILIQSSTIFSLVGVVWGDVLFCDGVNGQEHNLLTFLSCGLVLLQHVSVAHGDPLVVGLLSASGQFEFVAPFDGSSLAVSGFVICGRPKLTAAGTRPLQTENKERSPSTYSTMADQAKKTTHPHQMNHITNCLCTKKMTIPAHSRLQNKEDSQKEASSPSFSSRFSLLSPTGTTKRAARGPRTARPTANQFIRVAAQTNRSTRTIPTTLLPAKPRVNHHP
ncbi:hypothetical protein Nepgr_003930 [Nepenthes gracilis]|uniref:Uncharacterized protein n=1 Tax=Nepenthes gracilis TaxID=150966 RepID=A0AAD3S0J0_NEPGR|nr:hypothetical protein Nepgr_003930 [Nepenthes gracilis]